MTLRGRAAAPWRAALLVQSGRQFRDDGVLAPLAGEQNLSVYREVESGSSAPPGADEVWQHAVLKWTRMPPDTRTTSPWTDEPLRTAVGHWLMQALTATPTITDCADQAPMASARASVPRALGTAAGWAERSRHFRDHAHTPPLPMPAYPPAFTGSR